MKSTPATFATDQNQEIKIMSLSPKSFIPVKGSCKQVPLTSSERKALGRANYVKYIAPRIWRQIMDKEKAFATAIYIRYHGVTFSLTKQNPEEITLARVSARKFSNIQRGFTPAVLSYDDFVNWLLGFSDSTFVQRLYKLAVKDYRDQHSITVQRRKVAAAQEQLERLKGLERQERLEKQMKSAIAASSVSTDVVPNYSSILISNLQEENKKLKEKILSMQPMIEQLAELMK